jgi:shikimate 5-dehydrogenase
MHRDNGQKISAKIGQDAQYKGIASIIQILRGTNIMVLGMGGMAEAINAVVQVEATSCLSFTFKV